MSDRLSNRALSVLRSLDDGEWHKVGYAVRNTLNSMEARGLVHSGTIDEELAAIATDAGLAILERMGADA